MLATAKRLPRATPALLRGAVRRLAAPARADSNVPFATSLNASLAETDPQLFDIVEQEKRRQRCSLVLIPSENFASQSVLDALGSVMQNKYKYSEGYPHARYYVRRQRVH